MTSVLPALTLVAPASGSPLQFPSQTKKQQINSGRKVHTRRIDSLKLPPIHGIQIKEISAVKQTTIQLPHISSTSIYSSSKSQQGQFLPISDRKTLSVNNFYNQDIPNITTVIPPFSFLPPSWYMCAGKHYYDEQLGILPLLKKPALSLTSCVDFNQMKEQHEFCSSSIEQKGSAAVDVHASNDSPIEEVDNGNNVDNKEIAITEATNTQVARTRVFKKKTERLRNGKVVLSTILIEGPNTVTAFYQSAYRTTSEIILPSSEKQDVAKKHFQKRVLSRSTIDLVSYMKQKAKLDKQKSIRSLHNSISTAKTKLVHDIFSAQQAALYEVPKEQEKKLKIEKETSNDASAKDASTNVAVCDKPSQGKVPEKKEIKVSDNTSIKTVTAESESDDTQKMPYGVADYSIYVSRSNKLKKRLPVREPPVNPRPDLVIIGQQIDLLFSVSSVIQDTLIKLLHMMKFQKGHVTRLQRQQMEQLLRQLLSNGNVKDVKFLEELLYSLARQDKDALMQLLSNLDRETLIATLAKMDPKMLIEALGGLDPSLLQAALAGMDPETLAKALASMDKETLIAILASMDKDTLIKALANMDTDTLIAALAAMDQDTLIAALANMDQKTLLAALANMDERTLMNTLEDMDPKTLAALLANMDEETLLRTLANMDPATLMAALASMDPETLAALAGKNSLLAKLAQMDQNVLLSALAGLDKEALMETLASLAQPPREGEEGLTAQEILEKRLREKGIKILTEKEAKQYLKEAKIKKRKERKRREYAQRGEVYNSDEDSEEYEADSSDWDSSSSRTKSGRRKKKYKKGRRQRQSKSGTLLSGSETDSQYDSEYDSLDTISSYTSVSEGGTHRHHKRTYRKKSKKHPGQYEEYEEYIDADGVRQFRKIKGRTKSGRAIYCSSDSENEYYVTSSGKRRRRRKERGGRHSESLDSDDSSYNADAILAASRRRLKELGLDGSSSTFESSKGGSRDIGSGKHATLSGLSELAREMGLGELEDLTPEQWEMLKREAMRRDIGPNILEFFDKQKNEIMQRKQREKEAILRARQNFQEQKRLEEEQRAYALARKAARRAHVTKKLELLGNEIAEKKALFDYEEAVIEEMNHVIDMWDEVDYAYIELYLGKEYRNKIVALDRARKRKEAFKNIQRLIEIFDLKREELLLKLEQARELFYESLEEQSFYFDYQEMLTRAFVFSYFQYIPTDVLEDMMEQIVKII